MKKIEKPHALPTPINSYHFPSKKNTVTIQSQFSNVIQKLSLVLGLLSLKIGILFTMDILNTII